MKRFITIGAAVLLGLAAAQEVTPPAPPSPPTEPTTPVKPETPVTPVKEETPVTPVKEETPATPEKPVTPPPPSAQETFIYKSNALVMPWDKKTLTVNAVSC